MQVQEPWSSLSAGEPTGESERESTALEAMPACQSSISQLAEEVMAEAEAAADDTQAVASDRQVLATGAAHERLRPVRLQHISKARRKLDVCIAAVLPSRCRLTVARP